MKINTTFDIHQRVFYPDYRENEVRDFVIETIKIEISLMYSGSGGTCGKSIKEYYSDDDRDYRDLMGHNLCKTRADAEKKLKKYQERFPVEICSHCGAKKAKG